MAKKCIYCGMVLTDDPEVCPICGTPVGAKAKDLSPAFAELNGEKRLKLLWTLIICGFLILVAGVFLWSKLSASEETTVSPEEKYADHLFLDTRGVGVCKKLIGKVELFFVFVDDPQSDWTPEEKTSATEQLNAEIAALEKEALNFGVTLEIHPYYTSLKLASSADHGEIHVWEHLYARQNGYDSLAIMQRDRALSSSPSSAPVVFLFNYTGRSYAYSDTRPDQPEVAVLFEMEAFRHELFHLYGAKDFYYHQLTESSAKKYLPGSIMNDGNGIDDLTAYTIGWMETLTENAAAFLEATAKITYEDLILAQTGDQFTGVGSFEYGDGSLYVGDLVFGVPHGEGKVTSPDGSVYEGSMEGGYPHGEGKFTDVTNGYCYEGEFNYGALHGEGTLTYDDGTVYIGSFKDSSFHGYGEYTNTLEGFHYKGYFSEGLFHGEGTLTYNNGDQYVGEFRDGKPHGQGTYTYADGGKYEGGFINGKFDGQGTYTYADGSIYTGQFKNGKFDGKGTITHPDGTVESGTWSEGEFVG